MKQNPQIMEEVLQWRERYDTKPIPYDNEPTVSITPTTIKGILPVDYQLENFRS